MARPVRGRVRPVVVLQQTPTGWKTVRATVPPRGARSERVPRPSEHRRAVGAEVGLKLGELREAIELADVVADKIGAAPTAALALLLLSKGKLK